MQISLSKRMPTGSGPLPKPNRYSSDWALKAPERGHHLQVLVRTVQWHLQPQQGRADHLNMQRRRLPESAKVRDMLGKRVAAASDATSCLATHSATPEINVTGKRVSAAGEYSMIWLKRCATSPVLLCQLLQRATSDINLGQLLQVSHPKGLVLRIAS